MRRPGLAAALLLVLLPAALFVPILLSGKLIMGYDLKNLTLPFRLEILRALACGEWPLWMPDVLGGMPGIASSNLLFLYPSDLAGILLGATPQTQFCLDALLHVALAGLGTFLFLRRLDRSVPAALLGAACFATCGSLLSQLNGGFYNFIEAIALLPWALWAAHKGAREGSAAAWGLCGLVFGLQILSVSAQIFVFTAPVVLALALATAPASGPAPGSLDAGLRRAGSGPLRGRGPALGGLALALGLAFLIAAPQLWPSLQYLPLTTRQAYSPSEFLRGSIDPAEALSWLVPGVYGWTMSTYHGTLGGGCYTSLYLGLLPWALAAAALAALWRREPWVRWLCALGLLAFLASLRQTPLPWLLLRLPVLARMRIWSRVLFLSSFAACGLAAYGWDALQDPATRRRALQGTAVFLALALAAAAWAWATALRHALADAPALGTIEGLERSLAERVATLLGMAQASARMTLLLAPAAAALAWMASRPRLAGAALLLALALQGLDQRQVWERYVTLMDPRDAVGVPVFLSQPPPPAGTEPWRVWDYDRIFTNNAVHMGYENLTGFESVPLLESNDLYFALAGRRQEWLDLLNVRYVFMHSRAGSSVPGDRVRVYENRSAYPRAWLAGRVRAVGDTAGALHALADPGFDPRREVALDADPGLAPRPAPAAGAGAGQEAGAGGAPGAVRWLSRSPHSAALAVMTPQDAVLVLSNYWYPSWRCRVDGAAAPLLKADGGLQAVVLRAGVHTVELRFDAGLFNNALAAALAGLAAVIGLFFTEKKGRGPKSAPHSLPAPSGPDPAP